MISLAVSFSCCLCPGLGPQGWAGAERSRGCSAPCTALPAVTAPCPREGQTRSAELGAAPRATGCDTRGCHSGDTAAKPLRARFRAKKKTKFPLMSDGERPHPLESRPRVLDGCVGSAACPSQTAADFLPNTATAVPRAPGASTGDTDRRGQGWGGDRDRQHKDTNRTGTGRARTGQGQARRGEQRQEQGRLREGK